MVWHPPGKRADPLPMHAQSVGLYHRFFNSLLSGTTEGSIFPGNDVVKQSHFDRFVNWRHVIHMYNPANNPFVAVPHMIPMAYSRTTMQSGHTLT